MTRIAIALTLAALLGIGGLAAAIATHTSASLRMEPMAPLAPPASMAEADSARSEGNEAEVAPMPGSTKGLVRFVINNTGDTTLARWEIETPSGAVFPQVATLKAGSQTTFDTLGSIGVYTIRFDRFVSGYATMRVDLRECPSGAAVQYLDSGLTVTATSVKDTTSVTEDQCIPR